ncbi:hypothetical protein FPCIR_6750 [Fusarium pseudocircinatum]|uniref:Uncharacterized protein n=1 Tax=Fusarium pseudocircinatum TaxID=56676 RepID=A0A8H5LE31_9HYPO|nr:hypothetical protein FPCIR_6750 [Fusarium pseudocircinatum]
MTFRNLNQTWRDVIFKQYDADYQADVPFPITYLIFAPDWNSQDLLFTIPNKITLKTLKDAIRDFYRSAKSSEPIYNGEHLSVRPRKPLSTLPAQTEIQHDACSAWDFEVWPDSGCDTSPPSGHESGDGFRDCTKVPASHKSFEISNMGGLKLYLYSSEEECDNDEWEQNYDAAFEGLCIPPQFIWDYYVIST